MEAPLVTIRLAGTPRGKGRPKFSTAGGVMRSVTPAPTRNYEAALKMAAQSAMDGTDPLQGALDLLMIAVMPIAESWPKKRKADALAGRIRPTSKPDGDNLLKMTDALNGVVWVDDAQVADATVRKFFGSAPGLLIEVRRAEVEPPSL